MTNSKADRRRILGAGALVAGGTMLASAAQVRAQEGGPGGWSATAEPQDAWLDKSGTRHRMVFDATSPGAVDKGLHYANNFYIANESGYGLKPEALAVVVILRAQATPFGFSDAMWKKYGAELSKMMSLEGKQAEAAKTGNPLMTAAPSEREAVTLSALEQKGARYAVCGMATHGISFGLASAAGVEQPSLEAELKANLIPGAVLVPAGIVAVNRAQEHGYAFAYVS